MGKEKVKKTTKKVGRKWFDGKDEQIILAKLRETAQLDATVEESLYYADISQDSYYRYLKANPDFARELKRLRERPVLTARTTAVTKLKESYSNAMDYLKRKRKLEFGDNIDVTSGNKPLPLLGGQSINGSNNNGDKKDTKPQKED